jgi:hypothetical protein
LNEHFKSLSFEDVDKACTTGANGFYGKYYGINSLTLCNFLTEYKKTLKPKEQILLSETAPLSEAEKEKIVLNGLIEGFRAYKQNKTIKNIKFNWYNILEKRNLINLCDKDCEELKALAKQRAIAELNAKKHGKDSVFEINPILSVITAIRENTENLHGDSTVSVEFKKLAVRYIFEKLIKMNIELEDYLNDNCENLK